MSPRPALAAALVLLVAGCLGGPDAPAAETAAPASDGVVVDEARPDTTFADVITGPAVAPDVNATLEAPPRLVPGEWWRIKFDQALPDGGPAEVIRVVAEVVDDGYVVGMPHEGWFKEAISFHAPGFGDIGLDLSYATHNMVFQPVRFPLVQGDTWETEFATAPLVATVESVDGVKATIVFHMPPQDPQPTDPVYGALGLTQGSGEAMRLVYDASQHEIVRFDGLFGGWEVIEHGYDFQGWVTIPRGEHTAVDYGQFLVATPGGDVPIGRTIEVSGGYNRLTMMHAIFPLGPGKYSIRSVAPDGTEFVTDSTGSDVVLRFFEFADPDGTWTMDDVVAGPGITYSMGIAYHQYDIRLPDGLKRSDHSHEVIR